MPVTSNFGFDYESPSSLPGVTLTGGPSNASPILAVQIDAAMTTQSGRVDDVESDILAIQSDITDLQTDIVAGQTSITNLTNWTRTGTTNVSFSALEASTVAVTFGFTFPAVPKVMTNIQNGAAATSRWDGRAITVTTTGFTLFVYSNAAGSTSTWSAIPVDWTATYRP
jgi:hypothetical protein